MAKSAVHQVHPQSAKKRSYTVKIKILATTPSLCHKGQDIEKQKPVLNTRKTWLLIVPQIRKRGENSAVLVWCMAYGVPYENCR